MSPKSDDPTANGPLRSLPPSTEAIDSEWADDGEDALTSPKFPPDPKPPALSIPSRPSPSRPPAATKSGSALAAPLGAPRAASVAAVQARPALAPPPAAPRADVAKTDEPARSVPTPPPVDVAKRAEPAQAPPQRAVWYAALAAVVVGFGIWLAARPSPETPRSVAPSPAASQPVVQSAAAKLEVSRAPAPSPVAPPEPSPSASAAADATTILLKIRPEGARVYHRGKEVGRSPFTLELPRGETRAYEVGYPGYVTRRLVVDGSEPVISVSMAPLAKPAASGN